MTQPQMPVPPPAARRAGPGLAVSLVIGAVGLVAAIVSAVLITIPLVGTFTSTVYDVPGDFHVHLHDARYTVYQRSGTSSAFGGIDRDSSVLRIPPSQVSVTAPDGTIVPISYVSSSERITRGTAVYSSSLEFDAPMNGEYDIRFTNLVPTRVIIVRSIADAVRSVGIWFASGALGGLIFVLGLVMLIVGATRRGRQKRAAYMGWAGYGGGPYGSPGAQWGTPGVTQPYPPQYPPAAPPSASYPPGQYPQAGYPPPPPPPTGYGYQPPPQAPPTDQGPPEQRPAGDE